MKRLCIATQYFPPEMGAPQSRLSELALHLHERGWEIEVLTAVPNYPEGAHYEGHRAWRPSTDRLGPLTVHRAPLVPAGGGLERRIVTYGSFVVAATAIGALRLHDPDLFYVESPPLTVGLVGRALARRHRAPYVLNVSDLWPDSAIDMGMLAEGSRTTKTLRALESYLYRGAAGVTGQSPSIVRSIATRNPSVPVQLVTGGVDAERFGPSRADDEARRLVRPDDRFTFLYAGLFGFAQGLHQILEVADRFRDDGGVRFVLMGDGPVRADLVAERDRRRLDNVTILPSQPRDRIPALLAVADVAMITLGSDIKGAVPSKIYEAMASSLPVLLVAVGDADDCVQQAACGLVAPPGDIDAIHAAAERLASDPELRQALGASGRQAAETSYSRASAADALHDFLLNRLTVPAS